MEKVSKTAIFKFYHSLTDRIDTNPIPEILPVEDKRFDGSQNFPLNAGFFKGCVSISLKNS
jgi:hypothetical protein